MNGDINMIECENLVKIYKTKEIEVMALQGLDITVKKGEMMAIIGNSGSGKSSLLNMLGGLDKPSAGKLSVNGQDLLKFNEKQLCNYKRNTVGFVWQNNARNLIPYLTTLENIELPMAIGRKGSKRERALELLEMVGLLHRKNSRLYQLSGGEQQRIAIAIALANNPTLLLADEPTGAVDTHTMLHIMEMFRRLNKILGITIVIVTHDRQLSQIVDRVVAIRDGRNSSEFIRKNSYAEELQVLNLNSFSGEESKVELVVVDKAGRLQIPKEYLDALKLNGSNKVKVELEGDKIAIFHPDKVGA